MRLYLIAGETHAGKTSCVNSLKEHFLKEDLKVCTFQRRKGYFDLPRYWGNHFVLPPKAFENLTEFTQWIPAGYDIGIFELFSYSDSWDPYLEQFKSLFPDNRINEIIPPDTQHTAEHCRINLKMEYQQDEPPQDRDTTKIYSKLETPLEDCCTFTTDREIHRADLLQYIDIDGEYVPPRYDCNVLVTGFLPSEYYFMFPNLEHAMEYEFCKNVSDYDLGIIGKTDRLRNASAALSENDKIFSMYPPAYYDLTVNHDSANQSTDSFVCESDCGDCSANPKNQPVEPSVCEYEGLNYNVDLTRSAYPDIYYDIFADAPSIFRTSNRLIINSVPPSKWVNELRWF